MTDEIRDPLMKRGLLKVSERDGVRWFHANPNRRTQKLRLRPIPPNKNGEYLEKAPQEITAEWPGWKLFTFEEVSKQTGLPVRTFPAEETTAWMLVVERMERRQASPPARVIPITPLREFYQWLRNRPSHVNKEFLHQTLADSFLANASKLASLFVKSCEVFRPYDNSEEPFVEGRDEDRFFESEGTGTNSVVKMLQKNGGEWPRLTHEEQNLGFKVVDREVGPRRSSKKSGNWCYEDGSPTSDSGAGGIDILMASLDPRSPQVPIVGEIKVGYDETPFFALIQALTYAVELCTASQFKRLKLAYPKHFAGLGETPSVEVFVISSEPATQHEPILKTTMQLAEKLLCQSPFKSLVRRIAFLEVKNADDVANLICHGAFTSHQ